MTTPHVLDLRASPSPMPRIGADNLFRRGTITASAGTGRYAVDWRADRVWAPGDGVQTLTVILDEPLPADYCFLALHNLGADDQAATLSVQRWTGSAWATVCGPIAPDDGGAIWRSFDAAPATSWRIVLDSPASATPAIAILSLGQALELSQGIQPGWAPPIFAASADVVDSTSEDGLLLARSLHRRPDETRLDLAPLDDAWMRDHWRPVRERLIRQPFGLAWSPHAADAGTALAWTDGMPPADTYSHPGYMRIAWPLRMIERRNVAASDTVQEAPPEPPPLPVLIASIMLDHDIWLGEGEIADPGYITIDDYPT